MGLCPNATSHLTPSCLLLLPSTTIADGNASVPNSNALYVVVSCVARYSNTNDDMDILKQESLLEVGVDVNDPLL
jgi:hypothetical protein